MNLDSNGLPVQANGDANDQLQRCGMIAVAGLLKSDASDALTQNCIDAVSSNELLQPKPGVYVRHIGGDPANVSADQLIAALAAHVALGNTKQVLWIFLRCVMRLGFAQNYKDGLSGQEKIKIPDFMALRALPLFCRIHPIFYPLTIIADLSLLLASCSAVGPVWRDDRGFTKRGPDDVDDNNTILTLAVCRYKMPTPLSWLATRIYGKLRPWNYGCCETATIGPLESVIYTYPNSYHPVYGALRWYHRKENGGNEAISTMWRGICKEYFE